MKTLALFSMSVAIVTLALSGCSSWTVTSASQATDKSGQIARGKTLRAFSSDEELASYLRKRAEKQMTRRRDLSLSKEAGPASNAKSGSVNAARSAVASDDSESITNVQHEGVDEGDIVKLHGDYLVILRRGRLFTVAINERKLRPVSIVNSYRLRATI